MARVSNASRAGRETEHLNMFRMSMRKGAPRGPYSSLKELTDALEAEIRASEESLVPECTTSEFSLDMSTLVPLIRPYIGPYAEGGDHDLPPEFKAYSNGSGQNSPPQATVGAVLLPDDPHVRQIVQRAASRGIVAAIEAVDGFKYSFNNRR